MRRFGVRFIVLAMALAMVLSSTGCYSKPEAGQIGVVRNGGPFDNHQIRGCGSGTLSVKSLRSNCGIIPNGAGNTWAGWGSEVHYYPVDSQQRFFKMETCPGQDNNTCQGADAPGVTVPTADGVEVTIDGTFYLNTVFNDSPQGHQAVKEFDTQFATRTFDGEHAYDGNSGWSKFLAAIVQPIVYNNLRSTIGSITCAELVSSCALVQNNASQLDANKLKNKNNQNNIQQIQDTVENNLGSDLVSTLGNKSYFNNIKFSLQQVVLPGRVQNAIQEAQASFASVSNAQAKVQSAKLEAKANRLRESGYKSCPACAQIDMLKSIPSSVQTFAPGGNFAVTGK